MNVASPIRRYFAPRADPYAGGDFENAQLLASILFAVLVLLTAGVLVINPPTDAIGEVGWALAIPILAGGAALVYSLRRRAFSKWTSLLAVAYGVLAAMAFLQWLAGGLDPYSDLLLIPVFFVASIHPPRRIAVFLVFVGVALVLPGLYRGWHSELLGSAVVNFVIFAGLSVAMNLAMTAIRGQRLVDREREAAARQEAREDPLTGLANRRAFDEALETEIARARRLGVPLVLAMVDVENFKEVNDRWSYSAGDRCLRELASTLRQNIRQPDLCFRWGGDEFALILTGASAVETDPIAERLRTEIGLSCRRPDDAPLRIRFAAAELREDMSQGDLIELAGLELTARRVRAPG